MRAGLSPYAEGIAVEGMRLVKENLARAVKDGRDIEARGHMLAASQMGSTAFQKGLGAIHSLSHPVGAVLDTHHGLTNAVAMPYVLMFNRPAIDKYVGPVDWVYGAMSEGKPPRPVFRDGRRRSDGRRQPGEGRRARDAQDV